MFAQDRTNAPRAARRIAVPAALTYAALLYTLVACAPAKTDTTAGGANNGGTNSSTNGGTNDNGTIGSIGSIAQYSNFKFRALTTGAAGQAATADTVAVYDARCSNVAKAEVAGSPWDVVHGVASGTITTPSQEVAPNANTYCFEAFAGAVSLGTQEVKTTNGSTLSVSVVDPPTAGGTRPWVTGLTAFPMSVQVGEDVDLAATSNIAGAWDWSSDCLPLATWHPIVPGPVAASNQTFTAPNKVGLCHIFAKVTANALSDTMTIVVNVVKNGAVAAVALTDADPTRRSSCVVHSDDASNVCSTQVVEGNAPVTLQIVGASNPRFYSLTVSPAADCGTTTQIGASDTFTWNVPGAAVAPVVLCVFRAEIGYGGSFDVVVRLIQTPTVANSWPSIAAGEDFSVARAMDGSLWAWGNNSVGQLGIGPTSNSKTPVPTKVGATAGWTVVTAGIDHVVARKQDGSFWTWGGNAYGFLGLGGSDNVYAPAALAGTYNIGAAGGYFTILNEVGGDLVSVGSNWAGQLGDGTFSSSQTLVQTALPLGVQFTSLFAGRYHAAALDLNRLFTWGDNNAGQLGLGTFPLLNTATPTEVIGHDFVAVAVGETHTLAIDDNGVLYAWGSNDSGQLGTGDTTPAAGPVAIGTDTSWTAVYAGTNFSIGMKVDGSLWSWGTTSNGVLGRTVDAQHPANVPGQIGTDAWISVAAGGSHVIAQAQDGTLWSWGLNTSGQLGRTTTTRFVATPGRVTFF